jgi:TusA-related sulfurtransferase
LIHRSPGGLRWPIGGGTTGAMDSELIVDATGTACPVPIIELAKAIRRLNAGELVALLATDPAVKQDVLAWCASTGHQLVSLSFEAGVWRARVRKTKA